MVVVVVVVFLFISYVSLDDRNLFFIPCCYLFLMVLSDDDGINSSKNLVRNSVGNVVLRAILIFAVFVISVSFAVPFFTMRKRRRKKITSCFSVVVVPFYTRFIYICCEFLFPFPKLFPPSSFSIRLIYLPNYIIQHSFFLYSLTEGRLNVKENQIENHRRLE